MALLLGILPLCPQKIKNKNTKGQVAVPLKRRNSRPGGGQYLIREKQ